MTIRLRRRATRRVGRWIGGVMSGLAVATACVAGAACPDASAIGPLPGTPSAPVDPALLSAAAADPLATLQVIVQARDVDAATGTVAGVGGSIRRRLAIADGVAATVPAAALQTLAAAAGVEAVTLDARVIGSEFDPADPNLWQSATGVDRLWGPDTAATPAP